MTDGAPHPELPPWFEPLARVARSARAEEISRFVPPPGHHRRSAVLLLFGAGPDGPDVLLTERAAGLRAHPGQVAFPGGRLEPTDAGPAAAAVREAQEETGLAGAGIVVVGTMPDLYLPVSDYAVTPVLAWWREPSDVTAVDRTEVARAVRVPVAELLDPAHRFLVAHPSGYVGPGFAARGLFVWGFTAGILDGVFALAGWERPWPRGRIEAVPQLPPADDEAAAVGADGDGAAEALGRETT